LRQVPVIDDPLLRTSTEQYVVAWNTLTTRDVLAATPVRSGPQSERITALPVSLTNLTETESTDEYTKTAM
jgi:hypothetical protein